MHVRTSSSPCSSSGSRVPALVPEEKVTAQGEIEARSEHFASRPREIATAFSVIFLAEFGDLTQIQAANFSAKTHQPLEVFVAGSLAMICVSFIGAYGGRMLQRVVALRKIRFAGGARLRGARGLHAGEALSR